jgi:dihydrofolate synthase/folylpolyglutamate synthase
MTYHNAIKYILSSPQKNGAADSFERVRLICQRLGSPERRLKYIRFAGSNGKTVCQTMLESVLHEDGIKVGSLLMPVSAEPRENVRIGRTPISMDDTVKYVKMIAEAVNALKSEATADTEKEDGTVAKKADLNSGHNLTPTKNEMIFLVALLAFRDSGCDVCLIECDHNAQDPTKMLAPPFSAVICGAIPAENTREAHKIRSYLVSGIGEVVSAPQDPDTYKIISSACARVNCRLSVPTRSMLKIERMTLGGSEFVYRNEKYSLSLCGRFQINNATTVIEAVRMLNRSGTNISADTVSLKIRLFFFIFHSP